MKKSLLLLFICTACGGSDSEQPGTNPPIGDLVGDPGGGVTFLVDGVIFRLDASNPLDIVNVTDRLDSLSPVGSPDDESPAVSRNGLWTTITTNRFGCEDDCLVVLNQDISVGERVLIGGANQVQPDDRAAISNSGNLIVFSEESSSPDREVDLFAITRQGNTWSTPIVLTGGSTETYNLLPVLSPDSQRVLFDCGDDPFSQGGTSICSVAVNGTGFVKEIDSVNNPLNFSGEFLAHHGDYFADGTIAFEADWDDGGEQIWVLRPGAATPTVVAPQFSNDNTSCVLPGGYIASLWLQRDAGNGDHELKVMAPDASEFSVVTPFVDIEDVGMSCHEIVQ